MGTRLPSTFVDYTDRVVIIGQCADILTNALRVVNHLTVIKHALVCVLSRPRPHLFPGLLGGPIEECLTDVLGESTTLVLAHCLCNFVQVLPRSWNFPPFSWVLHKVNGALRAAEIWTISIHYPGSGIHLGDCYSWVVLRRAWGHDLAYAPNAPLRFILRDRQSTGCTLIALQLVWISGDVERLRTLKDWFLVLVASWSRFHLLRFLEKVLATRHFKQFLDARVER